MMKYKGKSSWRVALTLFLAVFLVGGTAAPSSANESDILPNQTRNFSIGSDSFGVYTQEVDNLQPWIPVPQKTDWPTRDMTFANITFGSDRDWILYRMGGEPDAEVTLMDGVSSLIYHLPAVKYTSQKNAPEIELQETAVDVTFYLEASRGVTRIDVDGDCEMTGRETSDGTLDGVLTQYGGPNAIEYNQGVYILWYSNPDNSDQRMWFEVKDGALTKRMGIVLSTFIMSKTAATQEHSE